MKKISILLALLAAFALTFVTTGCKDGEDGEDGASATELILKQTGNIWYKYEDPDSTATANVGSETESLADIYLKYNTSSNKLVMLAAGTKYYAQTSKDLDEEKWAASAVVLRVSGKISKFSDPIGSKTELTNFDNWGTFTIESLITKLFE